jgi:hypothetical protein
MLWIYQSVAEIQFEHLKTRVSIVWPLINLTCPIAFASMQFHFGVKFYILLAKYGLFGRESLKLQLI